MAAGKSISGGRVGGRAVPNGDSRNRIIGNEEHAVDVETIATTIPRCEVSAINTRKHVLETSGSDKMAANKARKW